MIMGAGRLGDEYPEAKVTSTLDLKDGVDESDTVIMQYRSSDGLQQTAISLATVHFSNSPDFGYIYGTNGSIVLYTEKGPSCPTGFRVTKGKEEVQDFRFDQAEGTMGFIHEADAVARDIVAGRTENAIMPLKESLRVMRLLDQIRAQNGLIYPQDKA